MLGYYYSYTVYDHSIPVVFLIILEFVKLPHVVVVHVYNLPISDWEIDSLTLLEHEHRFIAALYSKLLKRGETHVINTFQYMYLSLSFLA